MLRYPDPSHGGGGGWSGFSLELLSPIQGQSSHAPCAGRRQQLPGQIVFQSKFQRAYTTPASNRSDSASRRFPPLPCSLRRERGAHTACKTSFKAASKWVTKFRKDLMLAWNLQAVSSGEQLRLAGGTWGPLGPGRRSCVLQGGRAPLGYHLEHSNTDDLLPKVAWSKGSALG